MSNMIYNILKMDNISCKFPLRRANYLFKIMACKMQALLVLRLGDILPLKTAKHVRDLIFNAYDA